MSFDRFSQPVNICPRCRQEYIDCDCQAGDIEAARRVIGQRHKLAARHEVWAAIQELRRLEDRPAKWEDTPKWAEGL